MRMWMVDPKIMCRKHLLGEHVEHHMFVGTINKGISIDGYIGGNLLEPVQLLIRHYRLAEEMLSRGYQHKSELAAVDLSRLSEKQLLTTVDQESSLTELLRRCPDCRARHNSLTAGA